MNSRLISAIRLSPSARWRKGSLRRNNERSAASGRRSRSVCTGYPADPRNSCVKCHGRGKAKGDFQIDTRDTFLKGGESGPAVLEGKSGESLLIEMVSGLDPDNVMPQKGSHFPRHRLVCCGRGWTKGCAGTRR